MKKAYILFALMTASTSAFAATISPDEALQRFFDDQPAVSVADASANRLSLKYTIKADNAQPAVYIFDRQADNGCIFLAANDNVAPLLGYTDSGSFDYDTAAPALIYHLNRLANEIEAAPTGSITGRDTSNDFAAISPLCKTTWNQSEPYYNMTPTIDSSQSATGCVATAMAQVMAYHKWPAKGNGSISYTDGYNNTYSTDFSKSTYDWANMLDSYSGSYTTAQANAVAQLMKDCGYSVKMNYSPSESGALGIYVACALVDYFDYAKDADAVYRIYYTLSEWEELIYNQFKAYGPVMLTGQNSYGGHAFVADGYSANGLFHINWGWGGISNGYFLLSALNPSQQGIGGSLAGYSDDMTAIINVHKNTGAAVEAAQPQIGFVERVTYPYKMAAGNYISITGLRNAGSVNFTGYTYLEVKDSNGNVTYWPGQLLNVDPGYYYQTNAFTSSSSIADGTYTISFWYSIYGDDDEIYPILMPSGNSETATMTVTSDISRKYLQFSSDDAQLTVDKDYFTMLSPLCVGSHTSVMRLKITNTGNKEYYGAIYVMVDEYRGGNYSLTLAPGETTTIEYSANFGIESAGDYDLMIYESNDEQLLDDEIEVTAVEVTDGTISATGFGFTNGTSASSVDWLNFDMGATYSCSGGYFFGSPILYVFPGTGGQSIAYQKVGNIMLNDGTSSYVTTHCSFSDLEPSTRYIAAIVSGDNFISNYVYFTTAATTGIASIDNDNPDVKVALQGSTITVNAPCDLQSVSVYDINGRCIATVADTASSATIDIPDAPAGIYLIAIFLTDGTAHVEKLIK